MSFDSKFGLGAGKNQDLLQPSKINPFSLPGTDEADDNVDGFDFSSILKDEISQRIQDMNSPFHKTAQPILEALKTGAPIATDTIETMLTHLLAVAEALLEQLQEFGSDPAQIQEQTGRLHELKKTLNGIFDMGAIHRNPHAVSKLADLYKKMPPQTDQMVSTLFFQYTKIESFPAGTSSQDGHREEIAYFHFQMMMALKEKGSGDDKGSQKIDSLRTQLMTYSTIEESLDRADEWPEETISRFEDEIRDDDDMDVDDVSTTASDDAEMSDISDTDSVNP